MIHVGKYIRPTEGDTAVTCRDRREGDQLRGFQRRSEGNCGLYDRQNLESGHFLHALPFFFHFLQHLSFFLNLIMGAGELPYFSR